MKRKLTAGLVFFLSGLASASTPFPDFEVLRGVKKFQVGVWSTIDFDRAGVRDSEFADYVRGRLLSAGIPVVAGYTNRKDAADIFIYIRGEKCCGSGITGTVGFSVSQFCTVNENGQVLQVATIRDDVWICCVQPERAADTVRQQVSFLVEQFIESYREANAKE